jgi:hypothetical protein
MVFERFKPILVATLNTPSQPTRREGQMDKKHVFYGTSDFMIQDAMNCLAAGFKFLIFGGEVFFVSKKFASIDRIDDTSTMTVVEDRLLARTGIFEKDLIGDKWAQQVKGGANG